MIVPVSTLAAEAGLGHSTAVTSTQSAPAGGGLTGGTEISGGEGGSFGSELTEAISSLEKTQKSADTASQALATGKVADPETAVITVEEAQMAMDLASQLRTKGTEAVQNIFSTQV